MSSFIYYKGEKLMLLPFDFIDKVATKIFNDNNFVKHDIVLQLENKVADIKGRGMYDATGKEHVDGTVYFAVSNPEFKWLRDKYEELI